MKIDEALKKASQIIDDSLQDKDIYKEYYGRIIESSLRTEIGVNNIVEFSNSICSLLENKEK